MSVVIPVMNGEEVLPACFEALAVQDYPANLIEVVLVDDGSTDGTSELARAVSREWETSPEARPRLQVVTQENRGASAARNVGVQHSSGDVVVFTDADCEPAPFWISELVKPLSDPSVAAVAGRYLTHQSSLTARFCQAEFESRYRFVLKQGEIDFLFTHSAALRRSVFDAAVSFDERMPNSGEDLELAYQVVAQNKRIVFSNRAIVYHRHPSCLKDYIDKKIFRGYWRMLIVKRFPEKFKKDSYTPPSLKTQIVLAGLIFGALALAAGGWLTGVPALIVPIWILLAVFVVTTIPFVVRTLPADPLVAMLSPFYLFVQASAIGIGVIQSAFKRIEDFELAGRPVELGSQNKC